MTKVSTKLRNDKCHIISKKFNFPEIKLRKSPRLSQLSVNRILPPNFKTSKKPLQAFVENVKVTKSLVVPSDDLIPVGNGLFATRNISKGEVVCTYAGHIQFYRDAAYEDPTYYVDISHKLEILNGDNIEGDLGHIANSIHPENPELKSNARFALGMKQIHLYTYLEKKRGRFNIFAIRDIQCGEEIIVNYGFGYWSRIARFHKDGRLQPSQAVIERNQRNVQRNIRKDSECNTKMILNSQEVLKAKRSKKRKRI